MLTPKKNNDAMIDLGKARRAALTQAIFIAKTIQAKLDPAHSHATSFFPTGELSHLGTEYYIWPFFDFLISSKAGDAFDDSLDNRISALENAVQTIVISLNSLRFEDFTVNDLKTRLNYFEHWAEKGIIPEKIIESAKNLLDWLERPYTDDVLHQK